MIASSAALRLFAIAATALVAGGGAVGSAAAAQPRRAQPLVTLRAAHPVHVWPSAGSAEEGTLPARTPITEVPTTLPVLARHGTWLLVRLPGRPNGHTGWISSTHSSRSISFWHLYVRTTTRTLTVDWGGRPVRTFKAVVGKPSTPTPSGQFFVEETLALGPTGIGAPFALALSARSDVFQEFDGGPGQIAIHGLANVGGVPGTATSHGCVRVADANARWLAARIGAGVPVTIAR